MVALETPAASLGWKAAPFELKGTDGRLHTLESARGTNGLVVMFICNHCPYVKAVLDRIISDAKALATEGVNCIAIMSNDTVSHPDDSFENMVALAKEKNFPFPYVIDETQQVARAYDAVCTPDFFGFNARLELQYRGRLDESWQLVIPNPKRELLEAMKDIARNGSTGLQQASSIGCSIKWKRELKLAQS